MRIASNLLVSLLLAAIMSFAAPIVLIGTILGVLSLVTYFPGLIVFRQGTIHVLEFLAVFGNGKPFQGIVTLGLTVGLVGVLLDIFNFYRYQSLRD